jgi:hypothetical protein
VRCAVLVLVVSGMPATSSASCCVCCGCLSCRSVRPVAPRLLNATHHAASCWHGSALTRYTPARTLLAPWPLSLTAAPAAEWAGPDAAASGTTKTACALTTQPPVCVRLCCCSCLMRGPLSWSCLPWLARNSMVRHTSLCGASCHCSKAQLTASTADS